ncbi:helix-turn-helix transcriptional regulator [Nocardia sp. NPDC127526]|uniref:helix-turn-helix transcriptional regulator n=1 Tax=Nocardia sp. NPDC127526 TaxID=3345393 RepID=UPI0036380385
MADERRKLATPEEFAEYSGLSLQRLADMRYHGTGPKFIKYGRAVRYRWADIYTWEDANTFQRADQVAA